MPTESDSLFTRFPSDGGLYRIHWAGRLIHPKYSTVTPRVGVWLNKIIQNSNGQFHAQRCEKDKDTILLNFLDESAGSLPNLAVDTYWRDGRLVASPFPPIEETTFVLPPGQSWDVVNANAPISKNGLKRWIASHEYSLFGLNAAGQRQILYTAPVVIAKTDTGKTLLIPAFEIFRCYFAGCSDLALNLLSEPFQQGKAKLANLGITKLNENGEFDVELVKGISSIAARYMALFLGTDYGMYAVSEIHTAILNQRAVHPNLMPWIVARPPFAAQLIRLCVTGKWLDGGDRFLVYRITKSPFPKLPFSVRHIVEKQYIPIGGAVPPLIEGDQGHDDQNRMHTVGLKIAEAADSKDSKKVTHINSIAIAWDQESLPILIREAREKKIVHKSRVNMGESAPIEREVSVGAKSSLAKLPRASMSSESVEQIVSRFDALHQCLSKLTQDKSIAGWDDYSLIRPEKVFERTYCALVEKDRLHHHPWATIYSPAKRSRVVWVGQIQRNGHTVYWLDVEPKGKGDKYCALAFTARETPLKQSVLARLLDFCVSSNGRWPKFSSHGLQDVVTWVRATHRMSGTTLSSTNMLNKIDEVIAISIGTDRVPSAR